MTDRELLNAYISGREEAFAALVERHSPMAYSAAYRVLQDRGLAEDAAQAAFLLLVRKARAVPSGVALAGWLYTAAQHSARHLLRERQRRDAREKEAAGMQAQRNAEVDAQAQWAAIRPHFEAALGELPASQRDAIVLRCLEQRSPADAAAELGCAEGALAMRLQRGLETLRNRLRRRGIDRSAALLLGLINLNAAEPVAPSLASGIQAACLGKGAASVLATQTTQEVLKMMFWIKMKVLAAASAAAMIVCGIGGVFLAQAEDAPRPQPGVQTPAEEPPAAINGLRGTLELTRKTYAIGEKLALSFKLENVTDKEIWILKPFGNGLYDSPWGEQGSFTASVLGPDLKAIEPLTWKQAEVQGGHAFGVTSKDYRKIGAGEAVAFDLASGFFNSDHEPLKAGTGEGSWGRYQSCFGARCFKLTKAGDYRIRVTYDIDPRIERFIKSPYIGGLPESCWQGKIVTHEVVVKINDKRPADALRFGDAVNGLRLGLRMSKTEYAVGEHWDGVLRLEATQGKVLFDRQSDFDFKLVRIDGGTDDGQKLRIGGMRPPAQLVTLDVAGDKFVELKPFDLEAALPVNLNGLIGYSPPAGRYAVYCTYANSLKTLAGKEVWTGSLKSNVVEITVGKSKAAE